MQDKHTKNIEPKLFDRLIRVAYGDAGIVDYLNVLLKAVRDNKVKKILKEYRTTAIKVHKLKGVEFPDHLTENIGSKLSGHKSTDNFSSKISYSLFAVFTRRAIPLAITVTVALMVISFFVFKEPATTHKYTKVEIELAEAQLRKSLAIVGKVFTKAEKKFSQDILNKQLNKTLNKGYYLVNNILTGG